MDTYYFSYIYFIQICFMIIIMKNLNKASLIITITTINVILKLFVIINFIVLLQI